MSSTFDLDALIRDEMVKSGAAPAASDGLDEIIRDEMTRVPTTLANAAAIPGAASAYGTAQAAEQLARFGQSAAAVTDQLVGGATLIGPGRAETARMKAGNPVPGSTITEIPPTRTATLAPGVGGAPIQPEPQSGVQKFGTMMGDLAQAGRLRQETIAADAPSRAFKKYTPEWFAWNTFSSAPQMLASMATTAAGSAVGGPVGGFIGGAAPTFFLEAGQAAQQVYDTRKKQGASEEDALADAFAPAVITGLINAGIEQSGVQSMVRGGVAHGVIKGGIREWLKTGGEEGLEEVIQNAVTTLAHGARTGEWPTPSQFLSDSLENFAAGSVAGLAFSGASQAAFPHSSTQTTEATQNAPAPKLPEAPGLSAEQNAALDAQIHQAMQRVRGQEAPALTGGTTDGGEITLRGRGRFQQQGDGTLAPAAPEKISIQGRGEFQIDTRAKPRTEQAIAAEASTEIQPPEAAPSFTSFSAESDTPQGQSGRGVDQESQTHTFTTPEGVASFLRTHGPDLDIETVAPRVAEAQRVVDALSGRDTLNDPTVRDEAHSTDEARATLRRKAVEELATQNRLADDDQIRAGHGGTLPNTPLKNDRKAFLVLGPTAAGKSGISSQIADAQGARLIDNDFAKRKFPEFSVEHAGAALVHEESSLVTDELLASAVDAGENIVVPRLGANAAKVARFAQTLRDEGYSVHVVSVQLPAEKAAIRAISRFIRSGRYVPVPMILKAGSAPESSYNALREYGYEGTAVSSDVERGERPRHVEGTDLESLLQPDGVGGSGDRSLDGDHAEAPGGSEEQGQPKRSVAEGVTDERASNPELPGERDRGGSVGGVEQRTGGDRAGDSGRLDGRAEQPRPGQPRGRRSGRGRGAEPARSAEAVQETPAEPSAGDRGRGQAPESVGPREPAQRTQRRLTTEELAPQDRNHTIAVGDQIAPSAPSKKLAANIDALKLLKTLEQEGRNPSPEEKKQLAQYTGWGWAGEVLNPNNARYAKQRAQIVAHMSDEEYDSAKRSTLNAHYTSDRVIRPMWDLARRLGFTGGRVLEPAAGAGHFFGLMPSDLAEKSDLVGVELDTLSGRLLRKLYPQADIRVEGFQDTALADNSFDLAISNVPFGSFKIAGRDYKNLLIHDYFFARGLDKVKPGGLVMFITSDGTMNKLDPSVRELLAEKADLVGAVRLPNTAFAENAGTQVTTDIVVLRKKDGTPFNGQPWLETVDVGPWKTESGEDKPLLVNEYFAAHPSMALGKHTLAGTMYGRGEDYALLPDPKRVGELGAALDKAVKEFPENVIGRQERSEDITPPAPKPGDRPGSYLERDGQFVRVFGDRVEKADWLTQKNYGDQWEEPIDAKTKAERKVIARDFFALRDAVRELTTAERTEGVSDAELDRLRAKLNTVYDGYAKKWTTLNRLTTAAERANFLAQDPEYPLVQAIERETLVPKMERGVLRQKTVFVKGPIFTQRMREPRRMPTKATSIADAISISLGYLNRIDPDTIGSLLNVTSDQAAQQAINSGRAFRDPESGVLLQREQYLSGNVRKKLERAKEAAAADPQYQTNVAALEAAQPADVGLGDISFTLASRWMPPEITSAFASELFGVPIRTEYVRAANGFNIDGGTGSAAARSTWAVLHDDRVKIDGIGILGHALNGTKPTLSYTIENPDGSKRQIPLPAETATARALVDKMNREYVSWLRTTKAAVPVEGQSIPVQQAAEERYNKQMNAVVPVEYDGSYLALPGVTKTVRRLPHRMSVVARILQERAGVMAHGVGSGKTFSQIVAAMELRRLGLAKKPMIVVQKATLGQFAKSFKEAYPDSSLLVATDRTFASKNRKRLMAQIALSDIDAVIVTQPQFDRLAMSPKYIAAYVKRQVAELDAAIDHEVSKSGEGGGKRKKSPTLKQLEAMKQNLEAKLRTAIESAANRQDQALNFDELGVDFLLVDEAHAYKNIPIVTRKRNVKGIPGGFSDRALNTQIKAEYVQSRQGGRGIVLASGTPITNTMAEAYVMLSLAAPHVLREYDITNFDEFADTFGQEKSDVEFTWDGRFKSVSRFKKFQNGPELVRLIRAGFDVKMGNKELGLKVPEIVGGEPELVVLGQTPEQERVTDDLLRVAQVFQDAEPREKLEMSWVPIMTMQAGMAAALDPRLIDPEAKDEPGNKVNVAADRIKGIYDKWNDRRGTQVVFADRFFPMNASKLWEIAGGGPKTVTVDATDLDPEGAAPSDEEKADAAKAAEDSAFKTAKFNLYKDLRQKLVDRGIPADQIAIIHEANTDDRREKLFEKVNRGDVRVIIGSTDRLGVGVNIQERLVAAHHLDPPRTMTPAMMEQRDGRIIRQGNTFTAETLEDGTPNPDFVPEFAVQILKYGVERSMDTGIYQLLENKRRFIAQALQGRGVGRQFDDPADEVLMNMAQMKAKLTGDQRVLRLVELKQRIEELLTELDGHERKTVERRKQISRAMQGAVAYEKEARDEKERGRDASAILGQEPRATYQNKEGDGLDAAKEVLKPAWERTEASMTGGRVFGEKVAFTLGGRRATVEASRRFMDEEKKLSYTVLFDGKPPVSVKAPSPGHLIAGLRKLAADADVKVEEAKANAKQAREFAEKLSGQPEEPFEKMDELNASEKEVDRLERALTDEAKAKDEAKKEASPLQRVERTLDAAEANARARLGSRPAVPRGKNVGATTLIPDAVDMAIIVSARAIKAGIRGTRALTKLVTDTIAQMGKTVDAAKVRSIAKGILRDSLDDAGNLNLEEFERAVKSIRDRVARQQGGRPASVKETIQQSAHAPKDAATRKAYPEIRQVRTPSELEPGAKGLRSNLTYAEKATRRAYKVAARDAIRGMRPFLSGVVQQMREEQKRAMMMAKIEQRARDKSVREQHGRDLDMAKIEGRGKVDELKLQHEVVAGIREQIRKKAEELPPRLRGHFLTAVESAKTPLDIVKASRRMDRLLSRYQGSEAVARIRKLAKAKKIKRLTAERRQQVRDLVEQAKPYAKYIRRNTPGSGDQFSATKLREWSEELRGIRDQIATIYAEHQSETGAIKALRGMSAYDAGKLAARNIEASRAALKNTTGRETSVDVSAYRKLRNGALDLRGTLQMVEGKFDGSGVLERVAWKGLATAESRYFEEMRRRHGQIEQAVKAAGFKGLADAFEQLSDAGGVAEKTVTARLGGVDRTIGLGEALNLYANATDPDTVRLIRNGMPMQIASGKYNQPIEVTIGEIVDMGRKLDPKMLGLVKAFKGIMEEMRPSVFKAHYTLKGFEPEVVVDRWPRQRNIQAGEHTEKLPESREEMVNKLLENSGFLKNRAGGTDAPFVVDNILNVVFDQVHQAAAVAHMAVPVNSAAAVVMRKDVREAVAAHHGPSVYNNIKRMLMAASRANRAMTTDGGRLVHALNANVAVSSLALNPRTWARQVIGAIRLVPYIGAEHMPAAFKGMSSVKLAEMAAGSGYLWDRYVGNAAGRLSPVGIDAAEVDKPGFRRSALLTAKNLRAGKVADAYRSWQRAGRRAMEIVNFFDSLVARAAWGGFTSKVEAEHPQWSKERKARWVAEQTANAVRETQNGSSPIDLSVSAALHRDSGLAAMFLFTSEPLKTYNRLVRAWHDGTFTKQATAEAVNIAVGVVVTQALGWGLASAVSAALGGDDKDQERINRMFFAPEKLLAKAAQEFLSAIGFPVSGTALTKAAEAAVTGHASGGDLTPPALDALNQVVEGIAATSAGAGGMVEGKDKAAEKFIAGLEKFISATSTAFGLNPAQALWRQVWGEAKHHLDGE